MKFSLVTKSVPAASSAASFSCVKDKFNVEKDEKERRQPLLSISGGNMVVETLSDEELLVIPCKNKLSSMKRVIKVNSTDKGGNIIDTLAVGLNSMRHCDTVEDVSSSEASAGAVILNHASDAKELNEVQNLNSLVTGEVDDKIAAAAILKDIRQDNIDNLTVVPILLQHSKLLEVRRQKNLNVSENSFRNEIQIFPDIHSAAYDNIPVEKFGLAMLRGMGYVPNANKGEIKPLELKKRVYDRGGLGSDMQMIKNVNEIQKQVIERSNKLNKRSDVSNENIMKENLDNDIDEVLIDTWLLKGLFVKITNRKNKYYKYKGVVMEIKKDSEKEKNYTCALDITESINTNDKYKKDRNKIVYVNENDLQTVINGNTKKVIIVNKDVLDPCTRKRLFSKKAFVEEYNGENNYVLVRVHDKSNAIRLNLDDVCEYRNV